MLCVAEEGMYTGSIFWAKLVLAPKAKSINVAMVFSYHP